MGILSICDENDADPSYASQDGGGGGGICWDINDRHQLFLIMYDHPRLKNWMSFWITPQRYRLCRL